MTDLRGAEDVITLPFSRNVRESDGESAYIVENPHEIKRKKKRKNLFDFTIFDTVIRVC